MDQILDILCGASATVAFYKEALMRYVLVFFVWMSVLVANEDVQLFVDNVLSDSQQQTDKVNRFLAKLEQNKDSAVKIDNTIHALVEGKRCNSCTGSTVNVTAPEKKENAASQIIVFVTLSMSDDSLKTYAHDLQKINGRLVIRGLVEDSLPKTKARLEKLGIAIDIDPPMFDKFNIEMAPVIIHARLSKGEYVLDDFDRITGQVSLHYAIDKFAESGSMPIPTSWQKACSRF